MAPSASKLTEQNVRVIVIGVSVRARTIPSRPQMFCWGVYIWEGPDVCRTYSEKQAVMMGHARSPLPAALVCPPGQKQRQQPDRRFASALRTSAFPKVTTTSLLNQTGSAPSRIIINSEMVMSRMMASSQCWGCDAHGCNCSGKNHFCDVCHDFLLREWRNKAMLLGRLDYVAANSITLS
jgi:hypothetical protein